jgi:hypothetical protein
MRVVPASVAVFVIVRVLFWIGYRIRPVYRASGMAATVYLNTGLLGYGIWGTITG